MGSENSTKLERFAATLQDAYGHFELEPIDPKCSQGQIKFRTAGPFDCASLALRSIQLRRRHRALREVWDEYVFAIVQRGGASRMMQNESVALLGPGDIVLLDSRAGCDMRMSDCSQITSFHLPREVVNGHNPIYGQRLDGTRGMGRLLSNVLATLSETYDELDADESHVVTETVSRLFGSALADHPRTCDVDSDDVLISKIRRWLVDEIEDPDLSPSFIAAEFNMSLRRLYRVFASRGTTPSAWLWGLRLDEAHRRLCDARHCEKSVSQVAFCVGFNDAAHFSRSFKKRFGLSPTDLRSRS